MGQCQDHLLCNPTERCSAALCRPTQGRTPAGCPLLCCMAAFDAAEGRPRVHTIGHLLMCPSLNPILLYAAIGTADGTWALDSDSASGDASGVLSSLGGTSCQNLPTADAQSARISDPRLEPAQQIHMLCSDQGRHTLRRHPLCGCCQPMASTYVRRHEVQHMRMLMY